VAPPGALSLRVNAERLVLLGWSRAILLQLAHPLVAAGVSDHSGFRASPLAAVTRLHHTVRSMLALTFGNDESRHDAIAAILKIHQRVNGSIPEAVGPFPAGTRYSAEDPALVLWVHATLLDSVPLVFDLLVHPMTEAQRDTYCDEAAPVAVALGARHDEVPRRWGDVQRYLSRMYASGAITVGPTARTLARAVMSPPVARAIAPVAWVNDLVTIGLLPEGIRRQYGFTWSPGRERALRAVLRGVRTARRLTPDQLALWRDARMRANRPA
jgi:uncharacterized protein (DUF2236 family)